MRVAIARERVFMIGVHGSSGSADSRVAPSRAWGAATHGLTRITLSGGTLTRRVGSGVHHSRCGTLFGRHPHARGERYASSSFRRLAVAAPSRAWGAEVVTCGSWRGWL